MSIALTFLVLGNVYNIFGNGSEPTPSVQVPVVNQSQVASAGYDQVPMRNESRVPQGQRADYKYTPGIGGHKVHSKPMRWDDAKLICEEEGAELAIINSAAESRIIVQLFAESQPHVGSRDGRYAFLGFNDIREEGSFETIHGKPLAESGFYEWALGEPNNGNGNVESCGSVFDNGKLNDADCTSLYGFVCEIPDLE